MHFKKSTDTHFKNNDEELRSAQIKILNMYIGKGLFEYKVYYQYYKTVDDQVTSK